MSNIQHLSDLYEGRNSAILVIDSESRCVGYANELAAQVVGTTQEKLISQPLHRLVHHGDWNAIVEFACSSQREHRAIQQTTVSIVNEYGERTAVRFQKLLDVPNLKMCIVSLTRAENLPEKGQQSVGSAGLESWPLDSIEALLILERSIAHDLNNLLHGIAGSAELARICRSDGKKVDEFLDNIVSASDCATKLTRQMLSFYSKPEVAFEPIHLNLVAEEIVSVLNEAFIPTGVVESEFADDLPLISANPIQMGQVIMNLLLNAAQSLSGEGGTVRITTDTLECTSDYLRQHYPGERQSPGKFVLLEVEDTGCGMNEDAKAKIFDAHYSTKANGFGLGLASTLYIVRKHAGSVCVVSEEGKGTSIKLLFPTITEPVESHSRLK